MLFIFVILIFFSKVILALGLKYKYNVISNGYFGDVVKRFFSLNKALIFSIIVVITLGVTTGIFCALKSGETLTIDYIQGFVLRNFLDKKYSFFSYVFTRSIIAFIILFLIYFLSYLKLGYVIFLLGAFYYSYRIGINVCVIISIYSLLKGILVSILGYFIFEVCILALFMIFGFRMLCFNKQMSLYGNCLIKGCELRLTLFFFLLISILIVLQGIIISIIFKIFVF